VTAIEAAQNTDGGWPYYKGQTSWTEPTVFALLSELAVGGAETDTVRKGIRWLRATQNHDGGWGPQPGVGPSTWVTALAGLLPRSLIGDDPGKAGTKWLLEQTGEESTVVFRVRQWMMGNRVIDGGADRGWPWFPGTAAWVMPTAISILALKKIQLIRPEQPVRERIDAGRHFLVSHACKEGGWNHGSTHALGYEAKPYPETTGVALLALKGVNSPAVEAGLNVAEHFLRDPNCAGRSWLRLALTAHGRHVSSEERTPFLRKVNTVDAAIRVLSENSNALLA
jgi:hypothetical protein